MKTKHTPGPWRIGDAGLTVFGPPNGNPSPETVAHCLTRANARLIALAPELADAILECAEFARGGAPIYPGSELAKTVLALAAKLE